MNRATFIALVLIIAAPLTRADNDVLKTLVKVHPRLFLSDQRLAELKTLEKSDPLLAGAVKATLDKAQDALKDPIPDPTGGVARWSTPLKARVYLLSFAYRWTADARYAAKVEQNLLAVCAFEGWGVKPSFLNTAETTHLVGVGYDWCFAAFSDATRATIRRALVEKGLQPYLTANAKSEWWTKTPYNWNQVCNGGNIAGALAIAEDGPAIASQVISLALKALPRALRTYDQDGLWPEGMDYWQYAIEYTIVALDALQTALGTDFGLSDPAAFPGLARAATAPLYAAGPFNQYVNFADCLENKKRYASPQLFWLDRRYDIPQAAQAERQAMAKSPVVQDLIWYVPPTDARPKPLDLDHLFRGDVELATFRSAWDDPNALFVSLKAGHNDVNHGHLDLGVFELDALGARWSRDLGKDSYALPGYFSDREQGGKAWDNYRLRSTSHSVPLLNGKDQPVAGRARMTATGPGWATLDFTSAYPAAKSARRGVALVGDRRAALVQDEFDLDQPAEYTWAMTTDATIKLDGPRATLTLKGKTLTATILQPPGATFSTESAEQSAPQAPNKGVRRLLVRVPGANGHFRSAILLDPTTQLRPPAVLPLADWAK